MGTAAREPAPSSAQDRLSEIYGVDALDRAIQDASLPDFYHEFQTARFTRNSRRRSHQAKSLATKYGDGHVNASAHSTKAACDSSWTSTPWRSLHSRTKEKLDRLLSQHPEAEGRARVCRNVPHWREFLEWNGACSGSDGTTGPEHRESNMPTPERAP